MRSLTRAGALLSLTACLGVQASAASDVYSRTPEGRPGNGPSGRTGIVEWVVRSVDFTTDQYVVFDSEASDLVPGDTNGFSDIFAYKFGLEPTITKVTRGYDGSPVNAPCTHPQSYGRYLVWQSAASNLIEGDVNGHTDLFVYDGLFGVLFSPTLALGANGDCVLGSFSSPDRLEVPQYLVFQSSATNLVPGDTNGVSDIFRLPLSNWSAIERVSVTPEGGQANGASRNPISYWTWIGFESDATNLTSQPDTNGVQDVFEVDPAGVVRMLSRGITEANGPSFVCRTTEPTGIFLSDATNLVPGDTNGVRDAFNHTDTGIVRVSLREDGTQFDGPTVLVNTRYLATTARNVGAADRVAGAEVFAWAEHRPGARFLYGANWSEPTGSVFNLAAVPMSSNFPHFASTDSPNVTGGSIHAQVVDLDAGGLSRGMLISQAAGASSRRYGVYVLDWNNKITSFEPLGELSSNWVVFGANTRVRNRTELYVTNPATGQVALWRIEGMRARGWQGLGTLPAGWVAESTTRAANALTQIFGVLARRTGTDEIALFRQDGVRLIGPTLLGRLSSRLVGPGFFPAGEKGYSVYALGANGSMGGWSISETHQPTWKSLNVKVPQGWRFVSADGRYVTIQRESDGRIGAYNVPSGPSWLTLPPVNPAWRLERVILP